MVNHYCHVSPSRKRIPLCSSNDLCKKVHINIELGSTFVWSMFAVRRAIHAFLEEIESKPECGAVKGAGAHSQCCSEHD